MTKLLIANRGVIATRIQKACEALGIESIAVYSTVDNPDSVHVQNASIARRVNSYMEPLEICYAAQHHGADLIHPGVGFLSEKSDFAYVARKYAKFVGPSTDSIALMGDKVAAKKKAEAAGLETIPWSGDYIYDEPQLLRSAKALGFPAAPIMIKAAAGGGGMGMAQVNDHNELIPAYKAVQEQAAALFGNNLVYLESIVQGKRHLEVQLIGDAAHVVHVGERDCTVQRRNQKLIEYAPSALLPGTRSQMLNSAVDLAELIGYRNAGTVEFLTNDAGIALFMEMNTRIQVEHRVSEMVAGIDLVKDQIRVAMGESLGYAQDDIALNGYAIECRINAEDPEHDFEARPGVVTRWVPPAGHGVIVDTYIPVIDRGEFQIPDAYDSLIANVIVWGETWNEAKGRMRSALEEFAIEGRRLATTREWHLRQLDEL